MPRDGEKFQLLARWQLITHLLVASSRRDMARRQAMVRRRSRSGNKSDHRKLVGLSISGARGSSSKRGPRPARRSGALVALVLGALVLVNLYVFVWDKKTSVGAIKQQAEHGTPTLAIPAQNLETFAAPPPGPVTLIPTARAGSAPDAADPLGSARAPIAPPGTIIGKVSKSDTLGRLLKKNGLTAAEADEIIRALAGVLDFKTIRAGQTFRIERGPDGRVHAFELVVSKLQTVRAERDDKGAMVGKATQQQTKTEIRAIGGVKHDGGIETTYMHLNKFAPGQDVKKDGEYVESDDAGADPRQTDPGRRARRLPRRCGKPGRQTGGGRDRTHQDLIGLQGPLLGPMLQR